MLKVLKCKEGSHFQAGVINGPSGQGTLISIQDKELTLAFNWTAPPETPPDIRVIIGLPRPQTARKILNTLATLGASELHFVLADKSDRNYISSKLWSTNEWQRHLIEGAQQAFTTAIPQVFYHQTLYKTIKALPDDLTKIAFDNYEGQQAFSQIPIQIPLALAIGPEQGWADRDRELLLRHGFQMAHLGQRILRVETACVSALAITKSKLNLM